MVNTVQRQVAAQLSLGTDCCDCTRPAPEQHRHCTADMTRPYHLTLPHVMPASVPLTCAGAVLDGRDIGTVICPDAPVKLYVTADVAVRAQRRLDELRSRGGADAAAASFDAVLADMKARDDRDMNRATAPLKPADDAVMLDTTTMSIDQAFAQARSAVEAAMAKQQQEQQVVAA